MAATLTWAFSGLGTKTGTAIGNLFADLVTLITSKAGDAAFSWEVASSNTGSTPYQITLKPKAGGVGRVLLVAWSSPPAGANTAILDATPATNSLFLAFFPNGNVNTPSNLTAASGTIMGNDTGAVKVSPGMPLGSIYPALYQPYYMDSAEGLYFFFGHPGVTSAYGGGVGYIAVTQAGVEQAATLSLASGSWSSFSSGSAAASWQAAAQSAGASTLAGLRTNFGGDNRMYFQAFNYGAWAQQASGPGEVLADTVNSRSYFAPFLLIGQTKGEGFALKLRQVGAGPQTSAAFSAYSTTGPAVVARQVNPATAGGGGFPWFTNFQI